VSSYPAAPEDATIAGMIDIARVFPGSVGYSDHTSSDDTGALAAQCAACMLEKHLTYSNNALGPDHRASLEPEAFARYVRFTQRGAAQRPRVLDRPHFVPTTLHQMGSDPRVGDRHKRVLPCERDVRTVSRQSITTTRALPVGHTLTRADITFKRPGTGLLPYQLDDVLGRRLARAVDADMPLMEDDLSEPRR
jgi:sialic acid synthase SpsE